MGRTSLPEHAPGEAGLPPRPRFGLNGREVEAPCEPHCTLRWLRHAAGRELGSL